MRLGVLDVGSNTVHLLVVDAHPGANPLARASHKTPLLLAELLDGGGALTGSGVHRLVAAVAEARRAAERVGVEHVTAFATSALREATNAEGVVSEVLDRTGVRLEVLDGRAEAALTFLAARRWFGWSAGRLLLLDIGGGSLEIATGIDEDAEVAVSLPLGAGRLTRERLPGDPPAPSAVDELDTHVRAQIAHVAREVTLHGPPDLAVATSKAFRSLARIAGAAPSKEGPYVRRALRYHELREVRREIAAMPTAKRAKLPGVSSTRAHQLVAGAVVAEAAMDLFGLDEVAICPWALREGVILRQLDWAVTG